MCDSVFWEGRGGVGQPAIDCRHRAVASHGAGGGGRPKEFATYEAVFEFYDIPVSDALEDGDLALEVLEQFGCQLAADDSLDRH